VENHQNPPREGTYTSKLGREYWYLDLRLAAHMLEFGHLAELTPTDSES
jgi:hypothetical protein